MKIEELIDKMTLEEKASICSGEGFWYTKAVERLGIKPMMMSDGPHGLRKQKDDAEEGDYQDSIKSVCFPTGSAIASSFDRELIREVGQALGEHCLSESVDILLGPAMNIKRSPLCGRNFEYLSEDPFLSGEMAASQINGIQSRHVGASVKHFAVNNQENNRMSINAIVDERTLRELYLAGFERVIKKSSPWTIMCSYNQLNGQYLAENHKILTGVLREEWKYSGAVISDWGATSDRVKGLKAGLDVEMPSSHGYNDLAIVKAVKSGELSEKCLEQSVRRILLLHERCHNEEKKKTSVEYEALHQLARKASSESMVLLKNEGELPLKKEDSVAFIGAFAKHPRFQGGGSSHINAFKTVSSIEAANHKVQYAKGYQLNSEEIDEELVEEAVRLAGNVEHVVVFAGLYDSMESEGYDRKHMKLPRNHDDLIDRISKVQKNVTVVLHNGAPVEMPWICNVKAILEAYLGGQAVGQALVDVLYGEVNPSGRLAETFPVKLEDSPAFLTYNPEVGSVYYGEGIFVGYRFYDTKEARVLFPFGHGLSYSEFEYDSLEIEKDSVNPYSYKVSVNITNTSNIRGKEVAQLYVSPPGKVISRPVQELKGFEKVELGPGESRTICFDLDERSFAYYDTNSNKWEIEDGEHLVFIGKSSRNYVLQGEILLKGSKLKLEYVTRNTPVHKVKDDPRLTKLFKVFIEGKRQAFSPDSDQSKVSKDTFTDEMTMAMFNEMPLRNLIPFGDGSIKFDQLDELIVTMNKILEQEEIH